MIPRRRSAKRCWTNCWPRWRPALAAPLERFCEQEGGSERALRQQFRQQTGMTINHYLRQLRICHAQYLLQHTERLIGDIAMQCGFEDSNYFSVVFSREIGMSPGQWRQRSRAAA